MAIKGWTGRRTLTTCVVMAAIGVSGLAPGTAAAESHTRAAPYDFGGRCHVVFDLGECHADPISMTTGAVDKVLVCNIQLQPLNGCGISYAAQEWSAVGIFVDVDSPTTLTATVAAVVFGTADLCVSVYSPGGGHVGLGCARGPGPVRLQAVVAEVRVGRYQVSVSPDHVIGPRGLPAATAATVKSITYEVAP